MALSVAALTTVARMEAEMDVSGATSTLEPLIEEASAVLQSECGRNFYYAEDVAEQVKGYGSPNLAVRQHVPVLSVASITLKSGDSTTTEDSSNYEIDDADVGTIRQKSGCWAWTTVLNSDITADPVAGAEQKRYTVTYTGGFITPAQEDDGVGSRTLPYDIERAVIDAVKALYWSRGRDPSVASKTVSKASVSYTSTISELPSVRAVVEKYRFLGVA